MCRDHSSFSLLRRILQLLSVVLWAVLGSLLLAAGLRSSCGGPRAAARLGPCYIPMANPPSLGKALPLLTIIPTSFLTGTGAEGSVDGLGRTGGDTGLSQQAIVTLQPGWAQEAPSVTEPPGGSSLIKGCRS